MVRVKFPGPNPAVPVFSISAAEAATYHSVAHPEPCWCDELDEGDFLDRVALEFSRAAGVPVSRAGMRLDVVGPELRTDNGRRSSRALIAVYQPLYEAFTASGGG